MVNGWNGTIVGKRVKSAILYQAEKLGKKEEFEKLYEELETRYQSLTNQ